MCRRGREIRKCGRGRDLLKCVGEEERYVSVWERKIIV